MGREDYSDACDDYVDQISKDNGRTWGPAVPHLKSRDLPEGKIRYIEPAACFEPDTAKLVVLTNKRLVRPNGNWPRTPLLIAQVCEEPFSIRRDSITVIDRQQPGEPEQVQHSNFRFYQDRENGDVVLFLTRYGERSARDWMLADYYRYRIAI